MKRDVTAAVAPRSTTPATAEFVSAGASAGAAVSGPGGPIAVVKPRLLLVDDERNVADGVALHLRRSYEIVIRTSGASGLEALTSGEPFTAVISDLRRPQMDGVEVLKEVRQRAPDTTRILLTGYADLTAAVAAVNEAGVHRFLTKPCPPAHLARALEEAIAAAAASRTVRIDEQMTRLGRQATLGTMAGCIGHEIGNLVAALAGSLELVQVQVDRAEVPASEDIGLLSLIKNRLQDHTRVLKDLARPRERRIETLDLGMMVCSAVELLKKAGVLKSVRVQIELPNVPYHVDADRGLIEGVLINLLKNASEAIAEKVHSSRLRRRDFDTEESLITVTVEERGEMAAAILVTDNGPGMAPEIIERLFKTYFTTKNNAGGTGLGLPIVRETIEQHGGRISVASTFGRGSTFTVELPLTGCPPLTPSDRDGTGPGSTPNVVRLPSRPF